MYKLMLVDDEAAARYRVFNKINWNEYGFDIVGEAENGSEALELFEQYLPDVLITDIKMPFINGLELSEKILEKYPYTKIIILTGFDEFEYAKCGLNLHVMNYILKPVSSKELIKILQEVKLKLDEEINEKRDIEKLKEYYNQSYPLMKNKFFEDLLNGDYRDEEIEQWINYYDISLNGDMYVAVIVKIDDYYKKRRENQSQETELKKIALLNIINDLASDLELNNYFLSDNYVVIIESTDDMCEEVFANHIIGKMEKIRQAVEKYLEFTVTIGIGQICNKISELHYSKESALNAYDYKLIMGNNQLIYINDLEHKSQIVLSLTEVDIRKLIRILKAGQIEEWEEFIDSIFSRILQNGQGLSNIQIYLLEILTNIIRIANEIEIDSEEVMSVQKDLLAQISNMALLEEIKENIFKLGESIIKITRTYRKTSTGALVSQAKKYLIENYKNSSLTIEKISENLHYSPNYLSSVFKKETGDSLMNILLDVRLEAAKELLLTTENKSIEIAMMTGFSSSNYFAFSFKKRLGISPRQYRKNNKL